MRHMDRPQLESLASGIPGVMGPANPLQAGQARYELVMRDREYAEQQEQDRRAYEDERERSRRKFEMDRDSDRENFELKMFDEAGVREAARQNFEENLAQRQMDHATALAREQLDTARAAAKAAKWAAWAAGVAALGAIGQIIVAALK
jgi:hypothetical protein